MANGDFPRKRQRGRPPKYDWDKFFEPDPATGIPGRHILQQGVHFHTKPTSFRALVHATARARTEDGPWKAETQIDPNSGQVMFRFVQRD